MGSANSSEGDEEGIYSRGWDANFLFIKRRRRQPSTHSILFRLHRGRNCRGVNPTYELEEEYAGIAVFFAKETEYGRGMGAYEQKCADEVVRGHPKVFSGRVGVKLKSLSLRAMA